jgi:hypothetical protein
MKEADLFRQYAREPSRSSSKATSAMRSSPNGPCLHLGPGSVDKREGVGVKLYSVAARPSQYCLDPRDLSSNSAEGNAPCLLIFL